LLPKNEHFARLLIYWAKLAQSQEARKVQTMDVVAWLLEGDPSIRWQVMRDLSEEADSVVAAERSRIAEEGWGERILAMQTMTGQWGDGEDRGWLRTIYALHLLKELGVDPQSNRVAEAIDLVKKRITWFQLDGRPFFDGETEPCINGWLLGVGAYFGAPSEKLCERLLSEQLSDGGWNCQAPPSTRSSFHTSICVLEGFLEFEKGSAVAARLAEARKLGEQYLLERKMMRSAKSGAIIDTSWTGFAFPPTWHYDVLRGLDYLRSAGASPDSRTDEAIELIASKQDKEGWWQLDYQHPDRLPFTFEEEIGKPSRWNTLRALRVLKWHKQGRS
jgi:hypothetical protein